jgi:hypothetical protein
MIFWIPIQIYYIFKYFANTPANKHWRWRLKNSDTDLYKVWVWFNIGFGFVNVALLLLAIFGGHSGPYG